MANKPPHELHGPSDNANKTADALRDVPLAIRHQIQPPPSRNEVVVGPNNLFHSFERASKQTQQNASPHQHRSTPKNANKTTDALRDEPVSKGSQIQPPSTTKSGRGGAKSAGISKSFITASRAIKPITQQHHLFHHMPGQ